ncbi:hypothetical protein PGT21_020266 [Puccinia graminis f. sp. tritici]|uniref:Uncharacterized protein n=1 Tax=Puccinia graminis f. sp. tritici TaxID=56615 RepID=A0A5B0PW25_PUCGR|nr:hypothetical protein PGT21_020266 [Puccinia graminis f. sp. tritici]
MARVKSFQPIVVDSGYNMILNQRVGQAPVPKPFLIKVERKPASTLWVFFPLKKSNSVFSPMITHPPLLHPNKLPTGPRKPPINLPLLPSRLKKNS